MYREKPLRFLQRQLVKEFHRNGIVQFGSFRLALHEKNPDAPLSPIYIDMRKLRSFVGALDLTAITLKRLIEEQKLHTDFLADVPTTATPFVSLLAYRTRIPMVSPRSDAKNYGSGNKIDGVFKSGQTVLLIDDLITTAASKLAAIKILEDAGLVVKYVLVVLDREQGGTQELEKRGYQLHAALKLSTLMALYLKWNFIEVDKYEEVLAYISKNKPPVS